MRIFPCISKQHNQEPKGNHIELQYWYNVQVLKFTDKEPVKLVFLCDCFYPQQEAEAKDTAHTTHLAKNN